MGCWPGRPERLGRRSMGTLGGKHLGGWEAPRPWAGVMGEGPALYFHVLCPSLLWGPGPEAEGRGKAKLSFTKASERIKSPILVALKKREWDNLGVRPE